MLYRWRLSELLILSIVFNLIVSGRSSFGQTAASFRVARHKMVAESIEREGITNPRIVEAMRQVPRHEFVLPAYRNDAYVDVALPINFKQTISPPYIVAYMTQTIDPQPLDRVLEIGTGSGYQAAVLSNLAKEVYSIEIIPELGKSASERLKRLNYSNVKTKIGDGYLGWEEFAPFDKIIVTCSPERVPQPLIDQLKEGGRLLIPLGERYQQVFHQFEKSNGNLEEKRLISTLFVPMTGQSEIERQIKPDPSHPKILNGNFEDDDNQDGYADHWHYQRLAKLTDVDAPESKRCILFESSGQNRVAQGLQATAISGSKVGTFVISARYKIDEVVRGHNDYEVAGIFIHFYDENRRHIDDALVGPWVGTRDWSTVKKTVKVPAEACEMIVHIGLNGASGKLWLDDLQITSKLR